MQPIINFSGSWSGSTHTEQQTFQAAANWVRTTMYRASSREILGNRQRMLWAMGNGKYVRGRIYGRKFALFMIS